MISGEVLDVTKFLPDRELTLFSSILRRAMLNLL
jgi:hypothetical protein